MVIGVITPSLSLLVFSLMTGAPVRLREEWLVYLFQMGIAGAPFAFLALADIRMKAAWLTALTFTLGLWGYKTYGGIRYQLYPDGSGANIGLGLLMLASPLIIAAASLLIFAIGRDRKSAKE